MSMEPFAGMRFSVAPEFDAFVTANSGMAGEVTSREHLRVARR